MIRYFHIAEFERGLLFRRKDFVGILKPGRHLFFDPLFRLSLDVFDVTEVEILHHKLDIVLGSKVSSDEVLPVELTDHQRALVWVDGRLSQILPPGRYGFWRVLKDVRVEVLDASAVRIRHLELVKLMELPAKDDLIDRFDIEAEQVGLFYLNGNLEETLGPGRYGFWKGEGRVVLRLVELREQSLDVGGQEIMTADKVTLRLNAVVSYRVVDASAALSRVADFHQALYRDSRLALRAVVGTRPLDALLDDKDGVAGELESLLRLRAESFGLELRGFGIRDVILPGDMKDLLNKVTEAKKAAEANLITRREETAAVRSQMNVAKLLESNPTLMRLRELEVLEKVCDKAQLSVLLGERGLAEKVMKLL